MSNSARNLVGSGVEGSKSEAAEARRESALLSSDDSAPPLGVVAIVGRGKVGQCFARSLRRSAVRVLGPLGREGIGDELAAADGVLLCVPDRVIGSVARMVPGDSLVGHCSGASGLDVLGHRRAFSVHPLMTISGDGYVELAGVPAAVAGTDPEAVQYARCLAMAQGMEPFSVPEGKRVAYHAAASVASNLVMPLLQLTDELAASAGAQRTAFRSLITQAVNNWVQSGASAALTGPVARGDTGTVKAQRAAVEQCSPDRLELFDVLVAATAALAASPDPDPLDTNPPLGPNCSHGATRSQSL